MKALTIRYDPDECDLAALLDELAGIKGSRFEGRKRSEIGRMVFGEHLKAELEAQKKKARR